MRLGFDFGFMPCVTSVGYLQRNIWICADDYPDEFYEFTAADYAAVQASKPKEG